MSAIGDDPDIEDESVDPSVADSLSVSAKRRAGRPTTEQGKRLADSILDVAARHFLARGYDETVVEQIAAEAGTTKGAIYGRFDSKAGLVAAVGEKLLKAHLPIPAYTREDASKPLIDALRAHAMAMVEAGTSEHAYSLYKLLIAALPNSPEISAILTRYADFYKAQTTEFFEMLVQRGAIHLRDPALAASLFTTMIQGRLSEAISCGAALPSRTDSQQYVEQMTVMFLGGIARIELENGH